jgi:hypothetical protein
MSVWDYKAAHEIASAVDIHIQKRPSARSQYGHQLIGVYHDAKRAGSTALTGPQDLHDIRTSLCTVCRGDDLYKCDVSEGWSRNCEFLRQSL